MKEMFPTMSTNLYIVPGLLGCLHGFGLRVDKSGGITKGEFQIFRVRDVITLKFVCLHVTPFRSCSQALFDGIPL